MHTFNYDNMMAYEIDLAVNKCVKFTACCDN